MDDHSRPCNTSKSAAVFLPTMCDFEPDVSNFVLENRERWETALNICFPKGIPTSTSWTESEQMVRILRPFCAKNLNHTMLPRGGGQDMIDIGLSKEAGCIELRPAPNIAYLCRPSSLHFEYISDSAWNSFFLLETAGLSPSGIYGDDSSDGREELLELPNGQYYSRSHWDENSLGEDEDGREIPVPKASRLVVRHFDGKFLIVAKKSLWNGTSATYDGRHQKLAPAEIRAKIEAAL
jgi:hypothetical protein